MPDAPSTGASIYISAMTRDSIAAGCVALAIVSAPGAILGQGWSAAAQAITVVSRATPTAARQSLTEAYLAQPMIMAHGALGPLRAAGTMNLEGLTLDRGELTLGAHGEGYVDRRHPHAYLHEAVLGIVGSVAQSRTSMFVGRGFVPFGSDDPMARPFEKYPLNHHLAQVLERLVAVAAVAVRTATLEAATFNGDEPTSPGSSPQFGRFGDSWALRLTWRPRSTLELAGSVARVRSPEVAIGHGLNHDKKGVLARYETTGAQTSRYAMVEWLRTDERADGYRAPYWSWLAELAECRGGFTSAVRVERTDRPEEERLVDPFRTPHPHHDFSNLGVTRWSTLTAAVFIPSITLWRARLRPFGEISVGRPRMLDRRAIFSPEAFYGSTHLWIGSVGARLRIGASHDRMGRYGVALPPTTQMTHEMPGTQDHAAHAMVQPAAANRCKE
jgi:hypothetical protein